MEFEEACRLCNREYELASTPLFIQFFNRNVSGLFSIPGKVFEISKEKKYRYNPVECEMTKTGGIPKEKRSLFVVPDDMQKKMLQHFLKRGILQKHFRKKM